MGNLKRFLAMTLTMLMVVGCFSGVMSVNAFDDVTDHQDEINLMATLKIIEGKDEATFGYGEDVARWHMSLWIAKIMTGKVENAYDNWYNTVNYTAFDDVIADHFLGAVSYAAENGIIKGTSATTFDPDNGIMIQDVFTMVVRMLGYGSPAMDNNYPWSYIDKAIALGLDFDLDADYNNEETATREEAACILYRALMAPKADGTTFAEAQLNLTCANIVVTGTSRGNMFVDASIIGKKLAEENYVAFNILNNKGIVEGAPTYYLPESAFGLAAADDENLIIGKSYYVISKDNFASFIFVEENDNKVVTQADFEGTNADGSKALTIAKEGYTAVENYSNLYNSQNTKTTKDTEIIVYDAVGVQVHQGNGSYVVDKNLNILDYDGNILLYYISTAGSSIAASKNPLAMYNGGVYLYKISDGSYIEPDASIWARAATVNSSKTYGMTKTTNMQALYNKNAYSDTIIYDDNFDGIWDRAYYTNYKFGFISYDNDKNITVDDKLLLNAAGGKTGYAAMKYIDAEGVALTAKDVIDTSLATGLSKGNYVLYSYNPVLNTVTIKEILTPKMGIVTTVDKFNNTIAFDQVYYNIYNGNVAGTSFKLGNGRLLGGMKADISVNLDELQGKNVYYIEKDGCILDMYKAEDGANYLVAVGMAGYSTTGYPNIYCYKYDNSLSVATVSTIDGNWYGTTSAGFNQFTIFNTQIGSNTAAIGTNSLLTEGGLYSATTDALGNYHLKTISADAGFNYYYNLPAGSSYAAIDFVNGIAMENTKNTNPAGNRGYFCNANGAAVPFQNFITTSDTVFVIYNPNGTLGNSQFIHFETAKGIPQSGASISLTGLTNGKARIFVTYSKDDPKTAKFVYVVSGDFAGTASELPPTTSGIWNLRDNDTIIYVDDDTKASEIITNQIGTGMGVTLGATRTYKYAIDFIRGGLKDIYTNGLYNYPLLAGHFYRVIDSYVVGEVKVADTKAAANNPDAMIRVGMLSYVDQFNASIIEFDGAPIQSNLAYNFIYRLAGTNVINTSGSDKAPMNMRATVEKYFTDGKVAYVPVYYYAGSTSADYNTPYRVMMYKTIAGEGDTSVSTPATEFKVISNTPFSAVNYNSTSSAVDETIAKGASYRHFYKIDAATYASISRNGYMLNDNQNTTLAGDQRNMISGTAGVNFRMWAVYNTGANKDFAITAFNKDNVEVYTVMFQPKNSSGTNAGSAQYYLVFEAVKNVLVGDGTDVTFWYTNSTTLNDTYKISLPKFAVVNPWHLTVNNNKPENVVIVNPADKINCHAHAAGEVYNFYKGEKATLYVPIDATSNVVVSYVTRVTSGSGYYDVTTVVPAGANQITINGNKYYEYVVTMPGGDLTVNVVYTLKTAPVEHTFQITGKSEGTLNKLTINGKVGVMNQPTKIVNGTAFNFELDNDYTITGIKVNGTPVDALTLAAMLKAFEVGFTGTPKTTTYAGIISYPVATTVEFIIEPDTAVPALNKTLTVTAPNANAAIVSVLNETGIMTFVPVDPKTVKGTITVANGTKIAVRIMTGYYVESPADIANYAKLYTGTERDVIAYYEIPMDANMDIVIKKNAATLDVGATTSGGSAFINGVTTKLVAPTTELPNVWENTVTFTAGLYYSTNKDGPYVAIPVAGITITPETTMYIRNQADLPYRSITVGTLPTGVSYDRTSGITVNGYIINNKLTEIFRLGDTIGFTITTAAGYTDNFASAPVVTFNGKAPTTTTSAAWTGIADSTVTYTFKATIDENVAIEVANGTVQKAAVSFVFPANIATATKATVEKIFKSTTIKDKNSTTILSSVGIVAANNAVVLGNGGAVVKVPVGSVVTLEWADGNYPNVTATASGIPVAFDKTAKTATFTVTAVDTVVTIGGESQPTLFDVTGNTNRVLYLSSDTTFSNPFITTSGTSVATRIDLAYGTQTIYVKLSGTSVIDTDTIKVGAGVAAISATPITTTVISHAPTAAGSTQYETVISFVVPTNCTGTIFVTIS